MLICKLNYLHCFLICNNVFNFCSIVTLFRFMTLNTCRIYMYDGVRHKQAVMLICLTSILIRHYIFVCVFFFVNSWIICFSMLFFLPYFLNYFFYFYSYVMFNKPASYLIQNIYTFVTKNKRSQIKL